MRNSLPKKHRREEKEKKTSRKINISTSMRSQMQQILAHSEGNFGRSQETYCMEGKKIPAQKYLAPFCVSNFI